MAELRIITMSDIVPENVEWLWEPYIPQGRISIIQGDGGTGKTTISLAIAAAVTRGKALPGSGRNAAPADVVYQNAEDSYAQTIRPRLEQLGADCTRIHVIDEDEQELSLRDERIEETIVRKNARLIILDPIQAYLGGSNMNSANSVRPLMKKLGIVAERTGCAVLLVGHLGKREGKSQYRGLGSVDIQAAARSVLTIGNVEAEDNLRAVVHNKSNLTSPGASLAFTIDPVSGFSWLGEYDITLDELIGKTKQKPESQFDKAKRFIETILRIGPVSASEIMSMAMEHSISTKTLHRAKSALGVISRKHGAEWFWVLPIEVEYTEAGQDRQHGQDGHTSGVRNELTNMTSLANLIIFPRGIGS